MTITEPEWFGALSQSLFVTLVDRLALFDAEERIDPGVAFVNPSTTEMKIPLAESHGSLFPVTMTTKTATRVRDRVAATRARQAAAGLVQVHLPLPADIVAEIDRLKLERGISSRAPIMEEAIRLLIETNRA
jgi:hypothetical protein